uniref:Secreted protein n=1 Tax=Eutreptiella gymnastica TaxID=73025 RepID=A0A7S4CTT8_9EUGL
MGSSTFLGSGFLGVAMAQHCCWCGPISIFHVFQVCKFCIYPLCCISATASLGLGPDAHAALSGCTLASCTIASSTGAYPAFIFCRSSSERLAAPDSAQTCCILTAIVELSLQMLFQFF